MFANAGGVVSTTLTVEAQQPEVFPGDPVLCS